MPMILTGVKLGVGLSLILVVLAEMIGARSGLGYLVYHSWQIFAVQTMYAALIVIGFLGFAFNLLLNELELVILPWKRP
jgi:NitT/TauT family transport system permease protein